MKNLNWFLIAVLIGLLSSCTFKYYVGEDEDESNHPITISYDSDHYSSAIDGRLILLVTDDISENEPRFQLRDDSKTCQAFGR